METSSITAKDLYRFREALDKDYEKKLKLFEDDFDNKLDFYNTSLKEYSKNINLLNVRQNKKIKDLRETFKLSIIISVFGISLTLFNIFIVLMRI